jgi:hypothetical protein
LQIFLISFLLHFFGESLYIKQCQVILSYFTTANNENHTYHCTSYHWCNLSRKYPAHESKRWRNLNGNRWSFRK